MVQLLAHCPSPFSWNSSNNNVTLNLASRSAPGLLHRPERLQVFYRRLKFQPWSSAGKKHYHLCASQEDSEELQENRSSKDDAGNNSGGVNHETERELDTEKDAGEPLQISSGSPLPGVKDAGEPLQISSGSPLPGVKASGDIVQIPRNVLEVLRDQVFGFDTFFVTKQEPYEGGVLFRGNLRGDPAKSYAKINSRLQNKFGDQYRLYILPSPDDEKPVAIVTRKELVEPDPATIPEWVAASAFGLVTLYTILLRNSPLLQVDFVSAISDLEQLLQGIPGALVMLLILAAHEGAHIYFAREVGAKLGVPYFVPSLQLGSFGGITRITSTLSKRQDLVKIAAAGPLVGVLVSVSLMLVGFLLPPGEGNAVVVNTTAFHDSFLVGTLAELFLGATMREGENIMLNPLVLWAWAGLLINGINSIPVGELDGGRISQALWGRKVWSRVNGVSIALLGFSALFSDVSLYWVVLIIFLQRGPITPQAEEISVPDNAHTIAGISVLFLSLLICLPFPFSFS